MNDICACFEYNGIISLCENCIIEKLKRAEEKEIHQPLYDFLSTVTTYVDLIQHQAQYYAEIPNTRIQEFVNVIDGVLNLNEINYCEVSFFKKHLLVCINDIVGIENIKKLINENTVMHEQLKVTEDDHIGK